MNAHFGPSGNSKLFYESGHQNTYEAPQWLSSMGLDAFEYSLGRGITIGEDAARTIGEQFVIYNMVGSIHAPYFINFAVEDAERQLKNVDWVIGSLKVASWMGADRVIIHPGSGKGDRVKALDLAKENLLDCIHKADALGLLDHIILCPETMGKQNQLGNLHEIIALCQVDDRIVPCIDFGHLHAAGIGCMNTLTDFEQVLDTLLDTLGFHRVEHMHVHFSHIAYTKAGEWKHMSFADEGYGPSFDLLAQACKDRSLSPRFICESAGTQSHDALSMLNVWRSTHATE